MTNPEAGRGRVAEQSVDAVAGSEFGFEDVRLVDDPAAPPRGVDRTGDRRAPVGAALIDWLEHQRRLAPLAGVVGAVAERRRCRSPRSDPARRMARAPAPPPLTDLPIGCWTSAGLLDVLAGRRARPAATLLVGAGVLATVPTIAAGLADSTGLHDEGPRRVVTAHAAGNAVATLLYALSWRSRRRRHHVAGVAWGLAGATVATLAGLLGGHLAFASGDAD